jgi:hypothetical protein
MQRILMMMSNAKSEHLLTNLYHFLLITLETIMMSIHRYHHSLTTTKTNSDHQLMIKDNKNNQTKREALVVRVKGAGKL